MKILVTGAKGFVGRNVVTTLLNIKNEKDKTRNIKIDDIYEYDLSSTKEELQAYTRDCDFVIHLAGVNRPKDPKEFYEGNKGFTEILCSYLVQSHNTCPIIISSSIQAEKDNDYGKSKREGEDLLKTLKKENGNPVYIYRFSNLFGKWCRPNYNSVTATWCYNIANSLDIQINNPKMILDLCYIDDVVEELLNCLEGHPNQNENGIYEVKTIYQITIGELANIIQSFKESRNDLSIPNQGNTLVKKLYATYLSYLPKNKFSYPLKMNVDERGSFTEFIRTKEHGQISINISNPGIAKGNHWHHTKNEKFLVVSGEGLLQFRDMRCSDENNLIEYRVSGRKLEVIDIPTGYTHNIINVGKTDMVTVMWANEPFNPEKEDTYFEKID